MNVKKQAKVRCLTVLALTAGVLMLVLSLLAGPMPAVTPVRAQVRPQQGQHCAFQSITVTAALGPTPGVSDTVPGGATDREVYFSNPNPTGIITVSVALTGVRKCYLWSIAAFGVTVQSQREVYSTTPTAVITYPVASGHGPTVRVVLTSSESIRGSMGLDPYQTRVLTFTRDRVAPTVSNLGITTTASHLYPVNRTLYYTDTGGQGEFFRIGGESTEPTGGAGLWKTAFSSANLGCGVSSPGEQATAVWSAEYCLRDLPASGVLTATSYDLVGNTTPVTFTYQPDSTPPTSTVRSPADWTGLSAIPVTWQAGDIGSGVATTRLYYTPPGGAGWQDSGLAQSGTSGTFYFLPTGYGTYTFTTRATDNVGNRGTYSFEEDSTVVEPVYVYLPLVLRNYPPRPEGDVIIEGGADTVYQQSVTLALTATVEGDTVTEMRVGNDLNWSDGWEPFATTKSWTLANGNVSGLRTVYAQFKGSKGGVSETASDTIYLAWNGNFETGDLQRWNAKQGPFQGHGSGLPQAVIAGEGWQSSSGARLGDPSFIHKSIPVGYGYIAQTFSVGKRYLQIRYHVLTHDIVQGGTTGKYYDTFEVSLNTRSDQIDDVERNNKGCATTILNPAGTLRPTGDGLAFCGGYSAPSSDGQFRDLGWKTVYLDLQNFQQNITLYFAVWSREYVAPDYDDGGWYNTWTYIDDIQFVDSPSGSSAPGANSEEFNTPVNTGDAGLPDRADGLAPDRR